MTGLQSEVAALLDNFVLELGRETRLLQQLVSLRTRVDDDQSRQRMGPLFAAVDSAVAHLEAGVDELRRYEAEHTEHIRAQTEQVLAQQRRLVSRARAIAAHLPAGLEVSQDSVSAPGQKSGQQLSGSKENMLSKANLAKTPSSGNSRSAKVQLGENKQPADERAQMRGGAAQNRTEAQAAATSSPKSKRVNTGANTKKKQLRKTSKPGASAGNDGHIKSRPQDAVPEIRLVSESELAQAPQYVKGRLTTDRIAGVVAILNEVLGSKYRLLARPPRTLGTDEITRCQEFMSVEAECTELGGRPFFTDADIKSEGRSMDSTTKSVINVLRHVGAMKELRGKDKLRIFVVNE